MLKANGADLYNSKIAGKFDGYLEAWSISTFKVESIKNLFDMVVEWDKKWRDPVSSNKICYRCKLEQPREVEKCLQCQYQGFAFNNQITPKKTFNQFKNEIVENLPIVVLSEPEYKDCRMCAEPIRFKAIKCRYCGEFQ